MKKPNITTGWRKLRPSEILRKGDRWFDDHSWSDYNNTREAGKRVSQASCSVENPPGTYYRKLPERSVK